MFTLLVNERLNRSYNIKMTEIKKIICMQGQGEAELPRFHRCCSQLLKESCLHDSAIFSPVLVSQSQSPGEPRARMLVRFPQNQSKRGEVVVKTAGKGNKSSRQQMIDRANSSVRELSEQNRLRSRSKLRVEELCFRFKLKMMTLLRRINLKSEQIQIQRLQQAEPEQFIQLCGHQLTLCYQHLVQQQDSLTGKCSALYAALLSKTQQLASIRKQKTQKDSENYALISKANLLIKQLRGVVVSKQNELDQLQIKMIAVEQKNRNCCLQLDLKNREIELLIAQLNQYAVVNEATKEGQAVRVQSQNQEGNPSRHRQASADLATEYLNVGLGNVAWIIEEWRNKMYETVNSYERLIEDYEQNLRSKDSQILQMKSRGHPTEP